MTPKHPERSPLEPVFEGHTRIPFAFREQFMHTADHPYGMRLDGVMHTIWHKPAYLRPLFRALARIGILVPHNATEVVTELVVRPGRDPELGLIQVWDRTFFFPNPVRFRTSIIYDPEIGEVVDLVGPRDALYMVWDARFHPPHRFTLDTRAVALRMGKRKLWMPKLMWKFLLGTVTFSQVAQGDDSDTVTVDLLLTHPLFGRVFGYKGTFRAVRVSSAAEPEEVLAAV